MFCFFFPLSSVKLPKWQFVISTSNSRVSGVMQYASRLQFDRGEMNISAGEMSVRPSCVVLPRKSIVHDFSSFYPIH